MLQASQERKQWMARSFFSAGGIREYDPNFVRHDVLFFIAGHFFLRPAVIPPGWIVEAWPYIDPSYHGGPLFKYGDQGFINYAFNEAAQTGRGTLGYAAFVIFPSDSAQRDYPDVTMEGVIEKRIKGPYMIHFTGPARRFHYGKHRFGSILGFFYEQYYARFHAHVRWLDYWKRFFNTFIWERLKRKKR